MNSKVTMALRIILGLLLIVFGANKFANFMEMGAMPDAAGNFFKALGETGYMFKFIGGVEIIIGLLLIFNKWVALALIILASLSVNFLLFHINLAPAAIGPAALVSILNIVLVYAYWDKIKPLFK
jgi:uncharacterized membrane protein YphA (DoxX/SURF4 family)